MLSYEIGKVIEKQHQNKSITEILVETSCGQAKAINYTELTGDIQAGDRVVLNTTAIQLKLGTGGNHFVIYNFRHTRQALAGKGHIMKLRYTPFQVKVAAAEEQESPYHESFLNMNDLNDFPVLVGELHSMLVPLVATIKYLRPDLKIAYIMTDGAALPIHFSHNVAILKEKGLLDKTITIGHAFGGDLECVNIYTGLIAAREVAKCDLAIAAMGPGIVGTGTPYGFTGIEQGQILNAVCQLKGIGIAVPRISFHDSRARHQGMSHHTLTVLSRITAYPITLVLPKLRDKNQHKLILEQINHLKINQKHNIVEVEGGPLEAALSNFELKVSSMGRCFNEDRAFFLSCGAAAAYLCHGLNLFN